MVTAATLGTLALVIVGSIAPWVTSPLSSASGMNGDGKWTALLALAAAGLLLARQPLWSAIVCMAIAGVGIYDAVHIHHVVARVRFVGVQVDHVGWGVYVVIAAAVIAAATIYWSPSSRSG